MDGVKIMRPSLDDIDKNTVLRGVLAPSRRGQRRTCTPRGRQEEGPQGPCASVPASRSRLKIGLDGLPEPGRVEQGGGLGVRTGREELLQPERPVYPPADAVEESGTVKWYNATKGFGFIAADRGGKDIFVHASALERAGIPGLTEGQRVSVDVIDGRKGPEAAGLRLI
jgi:cold shock CspA family protein